MQREPLQVHEGEESFKAFYDKYSRPLWFYIYKICGDKAMADDVFQESFYRLLNAKSPMASELHQKSYLYKIAYNLIIDKKRRIKVEKKAFAAEKEAFQKNLCRDDGEYRTLLSLHFSNIFQRLKPKERTLLWLTYVEGYSHKEVAEITDSKINSVKVRLFRARKKIAQLLKENDRLSGEKTWQTSAVL